MATYFDEVYADEDTYICKQNPTLNAGDMSYLILQFGQAGDSLCRILLKFDIPDGTLLNAKLQLYVKNYTDMGSFRIRQVTRNWNENNVTWNNYDQVDVGTGIKQQSSAFPTKDAYWDIDITNVVGASAGESIALLIYPTSAEINLTLGSREGGKYPKLALEYEEAVEPNKGTLSITSEPNGATVYINDAVKGNTPFSTELDAGNYQLKLMLSGFKNKEWSQTIDAGGSHSVHHELEALIPTTGTVNVTSEPTNVNFHLDEVYQGRTPWSGDVEAGTHDMRLNTTDYYSQMWQETIVAGQTHDIHKVLEPVPVEKGTVTITSTPDGASFYVDGNFIGTTSWSGLIDAGTHTFKLTFPDYHDEVFSYTVEDGRTHTIHRDLIPITKYPTDAELLAEFNSEEQAIITQEGYALRESEENYFKGKVWEGFLQIYRYPFSIYTVKLAMEEDTRFKDPSDGGIIAATQYLDDQGRITALADCKTIGYSRLIAGGYMEPAPDKGYISGVVRHSGFGTGIPLAQITFGDFSTIADAFGNYALEITAGFSGEFRVAMWGYRIYTDTLSVGPGDNITKDVSLDPVSDPDPPVADKPDPWWHNVLSFDNDGTFHVGPSLVIVSKFQQWCEDNIYGEKASDAVRVIFYSTIAIATAAAIYTSLSGLSTASMDKMKPEVSKHMPDAYSVAEKVGRWLTGTPAYPYLTKWNKLQAVLGALIPRGKLAWIITGLIGLDGMFAWLASDNIATGAGFFVGDLADNVRYGVMSKADALAEFEHVYEWIETAKDFINTSTIVNPLLWVFRKVLQMNIVEQEARIENIRLEIEAAEEPETTVTVTITTVPSGAKIYVDDVYTFETTNTTIQMPTGVHKLTLKLEGYEDYEHGREYIVGEPVDFELNLTPVAVTEDVTVTVQSVPTGAKIYIDLEYQFETTNTTIKVPPGAHKLTLKLEGYTDHNINYDWPAGAGRTILVTLVPTDGGPIVVDQPADEVTIALEPTEPDVTNAWAVTIKGTDARTGAEIAAWILIDDDFKGLTTPAVVYLAQLSTFNIKLRLKGYKQGEVTYSTPALPA